MKSLGCAYLQIYGSMTLSITCWQFIFNQDLKNVTSTADIGDSLKAINLYKKCIHSAATQWIKGGFTTCYQQMGVFVFPIHCGTSKYPILPLSDQTLKQATPHERLMLTHMWHLKEKSRPDVGITWVPLMHMSSRYCPYTNWQQGKSNVFEKCVISLPFKCSFWWHTINK